MKRRDFLKGGAALLATGTQVDASAFSTLKRPQPVTTSHTDFVAEVVIHPLDTTHNFGGRRLTVWAIVDAHTGEASVIEPMDPIYRHPTANWWCSEHDLVPGYMRTDRYPWDPPVLPPQWSWRSFIGDQPDVEVSAEGIPRFVKAQVHRDIAMAMPPQRPWVDRRDDFPLHWVDLDLATGDWKECAPNDPIYDSEIVMGTVADYHQWETCQCCGNNR